MSKPRTFLSSTCYDLADARAALGAHLEILGFEVLLSERSTFGVAPKQHAHDAALQQVDNADYFVLIIGGRRGSTYVGSDKSITNEEYRRALRRKIPIMVFLQRSVAEAERAYGKNPSGDFSYVLDD